MSKTTKKFDVKEDIVKVISEEFIKKVSAGEILDLKRGHMNAKTERKYSYFAQLTLSLVVGRECLMNNKWLTLKQANDLDGQVLKGSKGTAVPYSSKAYSYKRPNGKTFKINAWSREEADAEAFKKDKAAKYESEYFFYRYYTVYNVEQTTLASEFTATPGYQAVSDSAKARALVEARLDDKRDFTERKLLILLGASFMTATKPNKDEMVLYQAWLSRLNEKPTFLYTLSTEAGRIVDEILEDIKAGRVAA